jgi:hypothetical protein
MLQIARGEMNVHTQVKVYAVVISDEFAESMCA